LSNVTHYFHVLMLINQQVIWRFQDQLYQQYQMYLVEDEIVLENRKIIVRVWVFEINVVDIVHLKEISYDKFL
jgi:hypothetical protein